jgi:hypothetical protein
MTNRSKAAHIDTTMNKNNACTHENKRHETPKTSQNFTTSRNTWTIKNHQHSWIKGTTLLTWKELMVRIELHHTSNSNTRRTWLCYVWNYVELRIKLHYIVNCVVLCYVTNFIALYCVWILLCYTTLCYIQVLLCYELHCITLQLCWVVLRCYTTLQTLLCYIVNFIMLCYVFYCVACRVLLCCVRSFVVCWTSPILVIITCTQINNN